MALRLCKHEAKTKDIVLTAKADFYVKTGRFNEAADIYAKTTKMFEDVAIMFHNKTQKDALRIYLLNKLKIVYNKPKPEAHDLTQLSCLCTWLTEMYLDKMNQLHDEGDKSKPTYEVLQKEFREFLSNNKKHLNNDTTFRLISSHGQIQETIYYAMLIDDYERVIAHCITERDFAQALEILNKFCKTRVYENYFYKFAPVLMQHLPKETVNALTTKKFLEPGCLIPALMRYITTFNPKPNEDNHVIRYLEWCTKKLENEDPAIHNLLLSLYANLDDDTKLLQFLNTEGENNFYDPKYALRICTDKGKTEACVRLYSMMGLYEDAVKLALNTNETKLARECADKPQDDDFKKKLWLRIAKHVIDKDNNVKKAIECLRFTDKIKLEDILPFFPDFVLIDDFKDEICNSLEEYKSEIEYLKTDMQEATQNANYIRDDIRDLKHRYGYITASAKCDSTSCFKSILAKDFYLFPCQHVFHASCLADEIIKFVPDSIGRRIGELCKKRDAAAAAAVPKQNGQGGVIGFLDSALSNVFDGQQMPVEEVKELDNLISNECPFCSDIMIGSIDAPFVDDEALMESWAIGNEYYETKDDE
ncbi:vacuolar protein sorting protein VPS18 [Acrasis kona]|uniref:Vacuolar protein sorting protein VPS18 n=1 Tax=Acrasis kona TaxID=1008807 RepID=A0AAW2YI23_9EUKA